MRSSIRHNFPFGLLVGGLLVCSMTASAQGARSTRSAANQFTRDSMAIIATMNGESAAFWNKDYKAWEGYWVHAPYARIMGWWQAGGISVTEGWDAISQGIKKLMQDNPKPNPTASKFRREKLNLQIRGDVAWVTFDQYGMDTGDQRMDMPGLSRETRVLEKQNGKWRIAYVGWLLQGPAKN